MPPQVGAGGSAAARPSPLDGPRWYGPFREGGYAQPPNVPHDPYLVIALDTKLCIEPVQGQLRAIRTLRLSQLHGP